MIATSLTVRDFRSYEAADVRLGAGLTVIAGRNGAGKTNLLEALYFACTGRSCRTANERECVRFGAALTRLELRCEDAHERHVLSVGFQPGEAKRLKVDGAAVERLTDSSARPLVSVFLPDRLELVLGAPALRRSHLDQVIAALWPARAATRRAYSAALAQRNALLTGIKAGRSGRASLPAWDAELARHGIELMRDRAATVERLAPRFAEHAAGLGLEGEVELRYRPRSKAADAAGLAAELAERMDADVERGFTGHGPHRDDLAFRREGRELRTYGSRGQQRLGLLALLLAEREELAAERGAAPLLLLDDVMSELDATRRERLTTLLRRGGQAVITTTELAHVPGAEQPDVARIAISAIARPAGSDREEAPPAGLRLPPPASTIDQDVLVTGGARAA
ncbi:DNA replication/repair protein RecF [Candidatus Solirubrobacter pratensis]|uniref:DNA replication/repair protein RecF n=1 Tax=Candidatus Solirubrobacter pratensis TaxID=1298857 RepID=UPI000401D01C|nr:DNA replication and repair protein RecF [Candidatus Solirubrobacter pratensis]